MVLSMCDAFVAESHILRVARIPDGTTRTTGHEPTL
jgi:hypothetical protein